MGYSEISSVPQMDIKKSNLILRVFWFNYYVINPPIHKQGHLVFCLFVFWWSHSSSLFVNNAVESFSEERECVHNTMLIWNTINWISLCRKILIFSSTPSLSPEDLSDQVSFWPNWVTGGNTLWGGCTFCVCEAEVWQSWWHRNTHEGRDVLETPSGMISCLRVQLGRDFLMPGNICKQQKN